MGPAGKAGEESVGLAWSSEGIWGLTGVGRREESHSGRGEGLSKARVI